MSFVLCVSRTIHASPIRPQQLGHHRASLLLFGLSLCFGCNTVLPQERSNPNRVFSDRRCPREIFAPSVLPFERSIHALPEFWLEGHPRAAFEVMNLEAIREQNEHVQALKDSEDAWPIGRVDPSSLHLDYAAIEKKLSKRMARFSNMMTKALLVDVQGRMPDAGLLLEMNRQIASMRPADELRVCYAHTPLRCLPTRQGVYEKQWQPMFDLLQCSELHLGDVVRVLAKTDAFAYVWSAFADGWVDISKLTPPLSRDDSDTFVHPKQFIVVTADRVPLWSIAAPNRDVSGDTMLQARMGSTFPLLQTAENRLSILIPTAQGLAQGYTRSGSGVSVGYSMLTRETWIRRLFTLLYSPYGWGGMGDYRDCSQLIMDVFNSFGLQIPRNSAHQSLSGTARFDVGHLTPFQKQRLIEEKSAEGILLLYLPGHIMLYLGKDRGHLFAFHQFSGYLSPCAQGGETMLRVNRTAITALDLGAGCSRRSFLERIQRLILFKLEVGFLS